MMEDCNCPIIIDHSQMVVQVGSPLDFEAGHSLQVMRVEDFFEPYNVYACCGLSSKLLRQTILQRPSRPMDYVASDKRIG
jgi:hypothetical protein